MSRWIRRDREGLGRDKTLPIFPPKSGGLGRKISRKRNQISNYRPYKPIEFVTSLFFLHLPPPRNHNCRCLLQFPSLLPFAAAVFFKLCFFLCRGSSSCASFAAAVFFNQQRSIMSKQTAAKKEHTTWTEKMDSAFIEAMIEQQEAGNRINATFTSQAYSNMVLEMTTKLNMNFTKDQLKNRMKSLKSNFSKWHDMFNGTALSGFSWNSETQLIEAEEEVWADLISAKPEAVILKTKKITNYEDLRTLFSKQRASGEYAETAKEKHARLTKSAEIKIEKVSDVDDLLANDVVTLGNQEEDDDEDIQILRQTFVTPQQSSGAKKLTSRKRKVEVVDEPAPAPAPAPAPEPESFEKSIMNTFSDIANVMREGNKAFEKHDYTMEDIENKLEPMGLEPEEFAKACLYLSRNQNDAKILFSSSMKMRVVFLKMMLSGDK